MKWHKFRSITFRLTLLFATASTVVLLLLGYLIAGAVAQHFEDQDMELLSRKLVATQRLVGAMHSSTELEALPSLLEATLLGHQDLAFNIQTLDGKRLYATHGVQFPPPLLHPNQRKIPAKPDTWVTQTQQPLRGISVLADTQIHEHPLLVIAIAADISHHEHFMRSFTITLWSFVILAACVTGFLGWIAATRGLAPLQEIKKKAALITANRLHTRLPVESVPEELVGLVDSLNDMLTRLETSFKQLSDFSSDIAHELRTPVSNLLTQSQVTLSKARSADEYREVIASNIEEFEQLSRTIADMLFLAKSDHQLMIPNRETLDLREEVSRLIEYYALLAEEKSIAMQLEGDATVSGDRLMLRRAISNLLSNALRHTPAGGQIAVFIQKPDTDTVTLSVENTGDTIPPEHLPRLFDRFYRVDSSRQRFGDGAGLGLAITRSIMRAHGGEASVCSAAGITVFKLLIPA